MNDKVFIDGFIFKLPQDNAPDFVKGKVSIKLKEFFEFAKQHQNNGWLNLEVKVGRSGKAYAELDTWKPKEKGFDADSGEGSDDIPF